MCIGGVQLCSVQRQSLVQRCIAGVRSKGGVQLQSSVQLHGRGSAALIFCAQGTL